jgi:subtilisin family serine protease
MGQIRSVLFISLCFFSLISHAETKRYLVGLKSAESLRAVITASDSTKGFLGSGARTEKFLKNINMVIIRSADPERIEGLRRNIHVKFIEEESFFPAPPMDPPSMPLVSNSHRGEPAQGELSWGVMAVKAPEAWLYTRGAGVRVLVIDGGMDIQHPDLKNRLEKGKSFLTGLDYFFDDNGHGTHVAGIIAADGGAGFGIKGVAPEAKLLIGKVCSLHKCNLLSVNEAIDWGISEKVDVINLSLGFDTYSQSQAEALTRAEAAGITVVASSGNESVDHVGFPGSLDTVLSVGSVDEQMQRAKSSQFGPELDVVAPGVRVFSTFPIGMGRRDLVTSIVKGVSHDLNARLAGNYTEPLQPIEGDTVYVGTGTIEEVQGKDLTGKIVLMSRGAIPYGEKAANVISQNVKAIVVFNNESGIFSLKIADPVNVPVFNIEQTAGEDLLTTLNQNTPLTLRVSRAISDYSFNSGTSMASPHVAGVAALLKAFNRNLTPKEVRAIVVSTAQPLGPSAGNEFGAGLVDAQRALLMTQKKP